MKKREIKHAVQSKADFVKVVFARARCTAQPGCGVTVIGYSTGLVFSAIAPWDFDHSDGLAFALGSETEDLLVSAASRAESFRCGKQP
jgi:hypothetical protein